MMVLEAAMPLAVGVKTEMLAFRAFPHQCMKFRRLPVRPLPNGLSLAQRQRRTCGIALAVINLMEPEKVTFPR